ncbi:ABC transporter permease [Caldimonas tepidiphila]|uniref:ABC transporter permease n=1 Tax=Caldimonas tepidiphila TaxID=2315841 RepID=UPI000E5A8D6A|nr:ABC transporter permease [Caldimonas tepidiphila]
MSAPGLAWRYLWARPLVALLNLLLLTLGLASVCFVLLASEQIERSFERDLAGIDLVVGAKGSPLQLILAGVFHLDVPSGNIPLASLETLRAHPMVAQVIPVSMGDSFRGHRIVGSTPDYLALYDARLAAGRAWQAPLEAVLGAEVARRTGMRPGDRFEGTHGLGEGGETHGDTPYTVTGVLAATGGVLDRLILTSTESVWAVHEAATALDEEDLALLAEEREVTLLLVRYRSPLAAVSLPRWVNAQTELQAAAPALETARLLRLVGVGTDVLRGFGAVLLLSAALSVFIGLYHAVREREGDLAMLRMLGAPPARVASLVLAEALWLALLGSLLGLALGHGLTHLLGLVLQAERSLQLSGAVFVPAELALPALAAALALLSAALPAWRAYRIDVLRLLQAPR